MVYGILLLSIFYLIYTNAIEVYVRYKILAANILHLSILFLCVILSNQFLQQSKLELFTSMLAS